MIIKQMRIIKRGVSTRILLSEDGKVWKSPEEIFNIIGDYDINIDTKIEIKDQMEVENGKTRNTTVTFL